MQLEKLNTWDTNEIVDISNIPKHKIINSIFIFTTKRNGMKECQLVARGDLQHPYTYDKNAYANTVHHHALMTCLKLALENKWFISQLDILSAYLYTNLEEDIRNILYGSKAFRLRELIKTEDINIEYINTDINIADILTKRLLNIRK